MIKSTSILATALSVLVIACAMAAFTAGPAAAQTAKKLKCKGCVKSKQIKDEGITSRDIRNGQVRNSDLGANAVDSGKIQDGSVGLDDLGFDPATQAELDNTDTLGDLTCANGQVAKWSGSAWECAADVGGTGSIGLLMTKIDNLAHLQARGASAYVFVTSETYSGNLGGVAGADDKCQSLADAAGLPGLFKAWIADSDPASAPASRFTQAVSDYILPPGAAPGALSKVADNWTALTTGPLDAPINVDEQGIERAISPAWTNVTAAGLMASSNHCGDWFSAASNVIGAFGQTNLDTVFWTATGTRPCTGGGITRLFCFGQ